MYKRLSIPIYRNEAFVSEFFSNFTLVINSSSSSISFSPLVVSLSLSKRKKKKRLQRGLSSILHASWNYRCFLILSQCLLPSPSLSSPLLIYRSRARSKFSLPVKRFNVYCDTSCDNFQRMPAEGIEKSIASRSEMLRYYFPGTAPGERESCGSNENLFLKVLFVLFWGQRIPDISPRVDPVRQMITIVLLFPSSNRITPLDCSMYAERRN